MTSFLFGALMPPLLYNMEAHQSADHNPLIIAARVVLIALLVTTVFWKRPG